MKRVLMFVPDARLTGGVISFLDSLLGHFSEEIRAERFVVGRRHGGWHARIGFLVIVFDLVRLMRTLRRERFDVVHVNPSLNRQSLLRDGTFLLLMRIMRTRGVCVFIHGWDRAMEHHLAHRRLSRYLFRETFGRAPHVFVLAERFRARLVELGCDPAAVAVMSTMFSGSDIDGACPERTRTRSLLFMSRFVREKGVHEVVDAFLELRARGHPVNLVLAGSGPEEAALKEAVAAHNVEALVRFTGYVRGASKAEVLKTADAFLLPTWHGEGCPVAVLEAMAAGLPVITTGVGGIPDVIEDGRNGFILSQPSRTEIVGAVERLIGNPALATRMGATNRREAWARYEASVVTRRIEEAYARL